MPEPSNIQRAQLHELDPDFSRTINDARTITVQFNPETLKVTFANQIAQNSGAGAQSRQFVGAGTTKLSLQVWFDVTAYPDGSAPADDVRVLTQRVAYFITPKPLSGASGGGGAAGGGGGQGGSQQPQFAPPAVRFVWGTFQFDGIMEQLEESLEFFSAEGRPLRAGLTLGLTQQKIGAFAFGSAAPAAGSRGPGSFSAGIQPLTAAPSGSTLPGLAASAGAGGSWQAIATANGIEDPLRLPAGQLVNLSAGTGSRR
ncbi:MAG: hypothetical protein QOE53_2290 [Pseudonocardiales bacterium]|nr:hypothetical protein [Pseudonocardiales bacterium]